MNGWFHSPPATRPQRAVQQGCMRAALLKVFFSKEVFFRREILSPRETRLFVSDASGHTLLETVVALALFMAVLVPAGATLGLVAARPGPGGKAEALRLAERVMERALARRQLAEGQQLAEKTGPARAGRRWRVERRVRFDGALAWVEVRVYSSSGGAACATLQAARFRPQRSP